MVRINNLDKFYCVVFVVDVALTKTAPVAAHRMFTMLS